MLRELIFLEVKNNRMPCVSPPFVPFIIYYSGQKSNGPVPFRKEFPKKTSSYIMASQSMLLFLHTAQNTHTAVQQTQFSVPNMGV